MPDQPAELRRLLAVISDKLASELPLTADEHGNGIIFVAPYSALAIDKVVSTINADPNTPYSITNAEEMGGDNWKLSVRYRRH